MLKKLTVDQRFLYVNNSTNVIMHASNFNKWNAFRENLQYMKKEQKQTTFFFKVNNNIDS